MNRVKIISGTIAGIGIITGIYFTAFKERPISSSDPIRIGYIGPLTGDGAVWGVVEKNTIELGIKEINAAGGINGRQLTLASEDGKCEGADGVAAAKKLINIDGIKILFISCSQEIIPIAPIAQENKVIAWTSYASASSISNLGEYIFRNSYSNTQMAYAMAHVAVSKGKKAAILSEISAFASDLRDFFINDFMIDGGTITANENFQQGAKDFRTQITKIINTQPEIVVINPTSPATGIIALQQLRALGFKGQVIGNFFGGSKEVQATPEAQGMIYVSDPVFADSPIKRHALEAYAEEYGSTPDLEWPLGARYDAVYILRDALIAVGDDPTKIKDYLHNMPSDFKGVLGAYRFEENSGDITNIQPSILRINNYEAEAYEN